MDEIGSKELRQRYAQSITRDAGISDPRIEQAFAAIPREAFIPPPPWTIISMGESSSTSKLADIYSNVLVALSRQKGINNGEPALHAAWLEAVNPQPGEHVVHIGAGTGYYTALLAHLVGPQGAVDAYEIDETLSRKAAANLAGFGDIQVHHQSAFGRELPPADIIYVNAGVNAPSPEWLKALMPEGRLIFPWQPTSHWGGTLLVRRKAEGFSVTPLMQVGFIPCREELTKHAAPRHMPEARIDQTKSLWLVEDRAPDRSATAVFDAVWFSSDEVADAL